MMADNGKAFIEDMDLQKEAIGEVHGIEANPAAAALAAATEAEKPRMFSKGMIRLWLIVSHVRDRSDITLLTIAAVNWVPYLNHERI